MKSYIACLLLGAGILSGCAEKPEAKIEKAPARRVPAPAKTPRKAEPITFYLYIPKKDGGFEVVTEIDHKRAAKTQYEFQEALGAADEALRRLIKKTPEIFPPGTKMIAPFVSDGGRPTINLNRAFLNAAWWENTKRGKTALMALTNTAIHTKEWTHGISDESSLRFFVEGKSIKKLGAIDLSEPIESDYLTMKGDDVVFKYMQNP